MVAFIRSDLEFILEQIKIAERHASGEALFEILPNVQVPWGLRTVSGEFNNLVQGQEQFGAADNAFPRLLEPEFRTAEVQPANFFGPGPAGTTPTSYAQTSGFVFDSQPRVISNLIADQTGNNPAAVAAAGATPGAASIMSPGLDGVFGTADDRPVFFIPNVAPDAGLSASFNAWFTFFGQFFDHGLDLVTKGTDTIFIPLQSDDPLIAGADGILGNADDLPPSLRFMVLSRATNQPGPDGVLGDDPTTTSVDESADDIHEHENTTSPFVDQNQTYSSHPSHQVFLRAYTLDANGAPVATGKLITNKDLGTDGGFGGQDENADTELGGMATWVVVKAQARDLLGINLTDADVFNVPLLATDPYGNFIAGPNGFPQVVFGLGEDGILGTADDDLREGDPTANGGQGISLEGAIRTGHQFLIDIAHAAAPVDDRGNPLLADSDSTVGLNVELALTNASFEADSMAAGAPNVIVDPKGNYAFIDPRGWDVVGPFGGVYAPTADIIDPANHVGGNVVFLDQGTMLARDTGVALQQGGIYQLTFQVGDRSDQNFAGGSVRFVTADGDVLASIALPTPADGKWASVTLKTGPIAAEHANEQLRIEIIQAGSGQVLIDNVKLDAINTYDDELLDAHYIAGDGRVNENIGLTAVHAIFHSEHNRLVDQTKETVLASHDLAFLKEWLLRGTEPADFPATVAEIAALQWNGERLFQAAKFGTEMQYQHLVFEEFARTIQPNVDEFLAPSGYDTTIDPSIVAEFAHTVYRFGHSMLTEQFDRLDVDFNSSEVGLIAAFLNPLAYAESGPTPEQATSAIIRGLTRQAGNEIDEFVTEALRNNLLGLPLDLASINIARGRDAGVPSLNAARAQFYQMTSDSQLKPYLSWADFAQHLKHPESLINFIAAYGTHASITSATDLDAKRAAATLLVLGGVGAPADRLAFLNATDAYAGGNLGGLNNVDFWIGGLAEAQMPFGGLLGSSFNFVFETQLEALQNGDRFYYLSRTAGLNFGTELEQNSFAKLVMLNADVTHLPDAIFSTPAFTLEVNPSKQFTGEGEDGRADPSGGAISINGQNFVPLVIRDNPNTPGADSNYLQYTGEDHVVLGGTAGDDVIVSGDGDDTLYGDGGNDRLEGGFGNDVILGGAGDDIIQDMGGDDNLQGGDGNDVIHAGNMEAGSVVGNLILGGNGKDFIMTVEDISTTFGGQGDDFIYSAKVSLPPTGNEGDDWIEWGTQDGAPGDNFAPFLTDEIVGNDIFVGGGGFDEMIGEGGDDIFVGSDAQDKMDGMSGFDWITYKNDKFGVTADLTLAIFGGVGEVGQHIAPPFAASPSSILDRFAEVEGLSGTGFTDILRGDNVDAVTILNHGGATGGALLNLDLIDGLAQLLEDAHITTTSPPPSGYVAGNIILGGAGGDILEGRGGDDLIDGDKWLNVRISVRANLDGTGAEIASFNSMSEMFKLMVDGVYNPGQLVAVREIKDSGAGFDTAVFSGARSQYNISFENDVIVVADSVVGRDGRDRLTNIERLQFADEVVDLNPALDQRPTGALTILDAGSNALETSPTEGQLLRVSIADVRDADNPGNGAVTGSVSYIWQVERDPGSGVFEDIIVIPAGDLAFQSANSEVFRVTPDLSGLSLRVKAIYVDAHGVPEIVFSAPTAPIADIADAPPTSPVAPGPAITEGGEGIHLIRADLDFILDQIRIAEAHTAGRDLLSLLPNIRAAAGLRTVDGSFNNLVNFGDLNQTEFGAADNVFPRLTTPDFNDAEDVSIDLDGPGPLQVGQATSYQQTGGYVFDSQPRTISNLLVDQTANNPAAYAAAYDVGANGHLDFGVTGPTNDDVLKDGVEIVKSPGLDGEFGTTDDKDVFLFPNTAPDEGLSASFNAWFTFFGQFFDHGLDLVTKGGSGTIFIPLQPDDPLYDKGPDGIAGTGDDGHTNFMVLTRATNRPGPDGNLGDDPTTTSVDESADDIHEHENTTSPFVDQNQTYSSHPSHQVFLRAYMLDTNGAPVATGKLITNKDLGADGRFGGQDENADTEIGGMATWAVVKAQARDLLGINLTDADFDNVPLLATDAYGNFIMGTHGFPQVVIRTGSGADGVAGTADDTTILVEGNPLAPIGLANAVRTGHAFLNDIAHAAVPVGDHDGNPATPDRLLTPDADSIAGGAPPALGFYDNELLDAHYIAGDGRVNENIGLTTVHAIFHSEHNRLVEQTKATVLAALAAGDQKFAAEWVKGETEAARLAAVANGIQENEWNGERLFQVAKFGTEMQYQHLVFEEFARTIQPNVDLFFAPTQVYDVNLDASIVAEFAHTVYRFGHSMLTETVDRYTADFETVDGSDQQLGLIEAFLNPLTYAASGATPEEATSAIVRGVTREVGNEIDEFVTEALRNNLLGLPLDLAAINIARGRDAGIPTLNAVRRQIYDQVADSNLKPYTSWADLVQHLKHPDSLINFIAAYGTHAAITSAATLADKRAAALALVLGDGNDSDGVSIGGVTYTDRLDFLNSTGDWANGSLVHTTKDLDRVTTTGLGNIDLWIGGLAEEKMPFGGMLGSTFNFVFENQLEKLQDGDRFYYLERTAGLSFNAELEIEFLRQAHNGQYQRHPPSRGRVPRAGFHPRGGTEQAVHGARGGRPRRSDQRQSPRSPGDPGQSSDRGSRQQLPALHRRRSRRAGRNQSRQCLQSQRQRHPPRR